jgi:hypothetical protein
MLKIDFKPTDPSAGTTRADGRKERARAEHCPHGVAERCAPCAVQQQGGA